MKRVFRRPSPAMLVAIAALIVALGGTAVAGGVLNKKKVKNISNNQITQRAPGLSVSHATTADSATNAGSATAGGTAFEAFRDAGPANITGTTAGTATPVATLSGLPAGSYVITAKNVVDTTQNSDILVHCRLTAEGDFDESTSWMGTLTTGDVFRAAFPTELTHTFASNGGTAVLSCYRSVATGTYSVQFSKVIALRVASQTGTAVTG